MIYENSRENRCVLFVSVESVNNAWNKWRASKMGSTNILIAAKHMNVFYFILHH